MLIKVSGGHIQPDIAKKDVTSSDWLANKTFPDAICKQGTRSREIAAILSSISVGERLQLQPYCFHVCFVQHT